MKIPTPSFKKIRGLIIVILIILFFLIIGLVKNATAWTVGQIYPDYPDYGSKCSVKGTVRVSQVTLNKMVGYGYNLNFDMAPYNTYYENRCGFNFENKKVVLIQSYNNGTMNLVELRLDEIRFESVPNCEEGRLAKIAECGGVDKVDWSTWLWETCNAQCKCGSAKQNKIEECGGDDKVDWTTWNDETCTGGECKEPCKEEKTALVVKCNGEDNVNWTTFDPETCTGGECQPCRVQKEALIAECGGMINTDFTGYNEETCTGGKCKCSQSQLDAVKTKCSGSDNVDWENFSYTTCDGECKPRKCTEEQEDQHVKEMLECDGIRYIWNQNTCSGECEELEPCKDKIAQLEASCGNKGYWLSAKGTAENPICEGGCKANCIDKYEQLVNYCIDKGGVGSWSDETCLGSCNKCDNQLKNCEETCKDKGGVADPDCGQTSSGQVIFTCLCVADVQKPGAGPTLPVPDDPAAEPAYKADPDLPPGTDPAPDPVANPEDPNQEMLDWQKAIKHDNDKLIEQNNKLREELIRTVNNLDNMDINTRRSVENQGINLGVMKNLAENMGKNVSNTQSIADQLAAGQASDAKGLQKLGEKLDAINLNLDSLKDSGGIGDGNGGIPGEDGGIGTLPTGDGTGELNEVGDDSGEGGEETGDSDGNGLSDGTSKKPEYTTPDHNFSDRTQQFVDGVKSTALFSIPNQIIDVPSGGTSTLIILGGETFGDHTIDFSQYDSALLILRSIFLLICSLIGFRIITLKR